MTIEQILAIHGGSAKEWHQHENGGGWVQNTSTVEKTAYIGPSAQVYGSAWVYGDAWVYGSAQVYGDAQVYGSARVYGDAQVYGSARVYGSAWVYGDAWEISPLYIQPSAHPISVSSRDKVSIGCKQHSIDWWLSHYVEVGKEENYTEKQITEYGALLVAVKAWMDALLPKEEQE